MKTNRLRAIARNFLSQSLTVFCAIFCASLISLPVAAQDPPATQSPAIQTENIVARPIPLRTVGLEPGKIKKWSLRDAIMTALDNNVEIELEKENVRMMQYDLIAAQGFYDPTTTSTILFNKSLTPTSSRASGLLEGSNTIASDALIYNFGATQNFQRWGSRIEADFNNRRLGSNVNTLSTSYQPALTFTFTQPLFRNFEIDQARRQIKITKKSLDLTDAQFRQRVILIISQVVQAYWDLSLAIKNEGVQRESVKLAETFLDNTKRQVEVGTQAPIETISAATQLEQRRQSVFQAMNVVGQAENRLKSLTASGPNDELWSSLIETVEPFDVKSVSIPVADATKLAHENRPEIRQQSLNKEINSINVDYFRNQAKPQIDLVASYSTNGLGGTGPLITRTNCSPITDPVTKQPICASIVPEFQNGAFVPVVKTSAFESRQDPPVADQFIGGYGTALGNLFKNQFRTWQVGVQITLPLRNRTAKANLGRQLEVGRQIDLQTRQLMQNIEEQVRNAVQSVETAKMRIEAAEAQERYALQQLDGENKRFAAGLQTTFFVLQRQSELSGAQLSKLQALADYNKAIANLQSVMSTTLSTNGIELKQEAPVTIK